MNPARKQYAAAATFSDKRKLAQDATNVVMRWEKVPPLNLFKNNTAAFAHELLADAISDAAGDSNYVRVQVLTPMAYWTERSSLAWWASSQTWWLPRQNDPTLVNRTWVLITESPDGG